MALVKRKDDATRGEDHNEKLVDDAVAKQQDRITEIVAAIDDLDIDTDYNIDNTPKVGAIEDRVGYQITAPERDQAFEIYNG